jgi:starch synthase (maltosyl-transferring)
MLGRVVIENVHPATPDRYPAKSSVGERVLVSADVFRDGHDVLAARVRWRPEGAKGWQVAPLALVNNDRWTGWFEPTEVGPHVFVVEAWTDRFATWRRDVEKKAAAGQALTVELEEGAILLDALAAKVAKEHRDRLRAAAAAVRDPSSAVDDRLTAGLDDALAALVEGVPSGDDLTRSRRFPLWVDRERARVGAWYELFPRSEGGFEGAMKRLPDVAGMGFDVVYLPPIHPIGRAFRKGPNNTLDAGPGDPGSPWAIGGEEGGHTDVHPDLGTVEDFDRFVAEAANHGLEVALDYALQCSPDHPWVREQPEWFHHRPDGTIRYAENPPKKYQDIYPINFWPARDADRVALWEACKAILDHWIDHGVRIFRVDNPHTKPLAFWEWLIPAVRAEHPDVLFLAEAFTRPKVMAKLAEVGFSQSYTYFTWRDTKQELAEYLDEVANGPKAEYMRPNFWPNTPDILAGPLRDGPPSAFRMRLVLAALMVPNYGMYSGYELCENQPASDANEEYLHSEKYEIKHRDWHDPSSLAPFVAKVNEIRRRHPALSLLRGVTIQGVDGEHLLAWSRTTPDGGDAMLVVVNLDPWNWHEGTTDLDLEALGVDPGRPFVVHDELTGERYRWEGRHNYVRLDPAHQPAHVFSVSQP